MTIKYWSETYQDSVSNRTSALQDTLRIKSDSTALNDARLAIKSVVAKPSPLLLHTELLSAETINVCSRNAIADITYYYPDYIISSIEPSGTNLFPFLFTEKTRQMYSDRKASVEKHLKTGEKMPQKLFHDDWALGIILAATFLFAIVRAATMSSIPGISRFFLFMGTKEESSRDIMGLFQWQSTILNLSSFLVIGLFTYFTADYYKLIPPESNGIIVWLVSLATIILAVTIRHLICITTGILSGHKEVFRNYLHSVYQSYRFSALLLFLLVIMMSYTSFLPQMSYFIIGAIFFISLYLIRIFRLFMLFINRNISIFYLILYLCALEILPVLIVVKYFSGLT